MGTQYNTARISNICKGCLSVGRKLTEINNTEYKECFTNVLGYTDQFNQELLLCWECTAIIRNVINFKNQVRTAHDCLVRYMVCQTTHITSLSKLSTTNRDAKTFYYTTEKDDKILIPERTLSPTLSNNTFSLVHIDSNYSESIETGPINDDFDVRHDSNVKRDENRPVFVKIEDNDFEFNDFYEDENGQADDKSDVVNLKTDDSQAPVSKKTKSKKKKRTRVEFDASDDEPLKPTKKEKQKKESTDEPAVKKRRTKKEKPPGVVTNHRVSKNLERLNVTDGQVEMVVLSWEELEAERQRALSSVVFTRHEYRCYDCALGFNHRFKLENHMKKHEPSSGPAECPVCHVRCRDDHALVAHKRRHRVRWRCVSCGETSSRAAVAADHVARAHGAAPTHTCKRCGLTCESLAKLRNHMKNHAERLKCELCGKTFRDRTSLRTHLFIHTGEKEYSCPHCDKKFFFKKAMEVHLVTHSAPAQLYCLECDMTFKNRMSYYQHKKYNLKHIDPAKLKYKCLLCDKRFLKAVRLEEHNFAVHLKVTPIRCTTAGCDFACSSRPVLRTHIRMVHRNLRAVRNHVCDTCGKAYTTKKTLEGHIRSHTGERPFSCSVCPSTFSYEAALYNHNKLVHLKGKTGRRPAAPVLTPAWPRIDEQHTG